jgi:hypothetical protein
LIDSKLGALSGLVLLMSWQIQTNGRLRDELSLHPHTIKADVEYMSRKVLAQIAASEKKNEKHTICKRPLQDPKGHGYPLPGTETLLNGPSSSSRICAFRLCESASP